jgi:hypothetical protein
VLLAQAVPDFEELKIVRHKERTKLLLFCEVEEMNERKTHGEKEKKRERGSAGPFSLLMQFK